MQSGHRFFRWCLIGAAFIVAGVAAFYLANYVTAAIAINNSGLRPFYRESVRAMWLAFCLQLGLLALFFVFAAMRPRAISRGAIMLLALMPLASTSLLFYFATSRIGAVVLGIATALVLIAAISWPTHEIGADTAAQVPGKPSSTVT